MITQTQAEPELTLTPDQEESHTPRRPAVYSIPRRWRYVALGIIILIVAIWIVVRLVNGGANQARYVTAPVQYQDISATVEESGTVNPVNEVDVGTQVSGTISSLSVDFNSLVRKGQVLATLDSTPLQAASLQAHEAYDASQSTAAAAQSTAAQSAASVQSAIANARTAVATEDSANANVLKAAAAVQLAQTTVNRDTSLLAQGYIAQSQMDADVATLRADQADYQAAQAALSAAKAQASAAQTQIAVAADQHDANVSQAEAAGAQSAAGQGQVQQADYNLARAVITSPIDGIVVARDVSVGQTVASSFQTPTLFVIASSLRDMQVDTSVSEADVGQLRTGATARITVPAYPNVIFNGTVTQVRVNPTNVSNVVTYDAIVAVHDESARLKPGMTADVIIAVSMQPHVLAIPAAALLFHPPSTGRSGGASGGAASGGAQPSGGAPAAGGAASVGAAAGGGPSGGAQGQSGSGGAPGSQASIYVLQGGKPVRVRVVLGVNDGRFYEVRSGALRAGDRVIIGQLQANQITGSNPIAGGVGIGR